MYISYENISWCIVDFPEMIHQPARNNIVDNLYLAFSLCISCQTSHRTFFSSTISINIQNGQRNGSLMLKERSIDPLDGSCLLVTKIIVMCIDLSCFFFWSHLVGVCFFLWFNSSSYRI